MKRKRVQESKEARVRPFQKREELLNECLSLTLKYNTEFQMPFTDLTIYRYAETLQTDDELQAFVVKLGKSIADGKENAIYRVEQ
tara:strand:- start:3380 stop:3634 length:255 start_codon:yes stop_codon:yes gene_type:complete